MRHPADLLPRFPASFLAYRARNACTSVPGEVTMKRFMGLIGETLLDKLGTCPRCMRTAFVAAACSVVLTCGASFLAPSAIVIVLGLFAGALTILWLAHAVMFTKRSIAAAAVQNSGGLASEQTETWSRRRVIGALFHTLAFSAFLGLAARPAWALGCDCWTESSSGCKCPPEAPNCHFNASTQRGFCCPSDHKACGGPTQEWCCPSNSDCSGNEGYCRPHP